MVNFTHFNQKKTQISACKIVHIYKNAIVTVHICTVTVALHTNILLISHFTHFFLSSLSAKPMHLLSLIIFVFLRYTHPHRHKIKNKKSTTNTAKSNTFTHRHTNKDRESGLALVADWCLWIGEFQPWWIGAWINE